MRELLIMIAHCRSALKHAHDESVAGLAADACNKLLVSGGYDGVLRIWAFKQRRLLREISVGQPISRMCHHASSALLSVATDDLLIRMWGPLSPYLLQMLPCSRHSDHALQVSCRCRLFHTLLPSQEHSALPCYRQNLLL